MNTHLTVLMEDKMGQKMDKKTRILIVDDDEGTRRSLSLILAKKGYEIETAMTGEEALKKTEEKSANLVLLDILLPDWEGIDLLDRLRERRSELEVIIITGHSDMDDAVRALNGGVSGYLTKPINMDVLLDKITDIEKNQHTVFETKKLLTSLKNELDKQKVKEDKLVHLACHDALTGLPNRSLFKARLTLELTHARRNRKKMAVMLLDLDHFKNVNDTLKHDTGDMLLKCVGKRLKSLLRESDTVARIGGDEFFLLLPGLSQKEDVDELAGNILEAVRKPYVLDGNEILITSSIGISFFPEDGEDAEVLMKNADIAMYQAKDHGRNTHAFYSSVKEEMRQKGIHLDKRWQYQLMQDHVLPLLRSRLNL